jgi:hypothetical protein
MKLALSITLALSLFACDSDSDKGGDGDAIATIVTVGGDYAGTGVLSTLSLPDMTVTVSAVAGVAGGDPVVRNFGDNLVILDRFGGDSVTVLDRQLQLLGQASTGTGSNPQDAAIIGSNLYVVALDAAGVLVFDLGDIAGGTTKTIDLAALDSADGVPDCNSIYAVGQRLFVSCQLLDRDTFSPRTNGKVAVIDTDDDSLELTLDLQSTNPLARFQQLAGGELVFSTAPGAIFGASNDSGCLERISTSGTPSVMGCLSENVSQNAYPSEVHAVGDSVYFVNVAGFTEASVWKHDGTSTSDSGLVVGSNVAGLTACPTGHLVVADNSDSGRGLRVFDVDGMALSADPVDVGWPTGFVPLNSTICW